jgi:transposase-like protein
MKNDKKQEAIRLRREHGLSLKEISENLQVSKSSVSLWVREVELTREQADKLSRRHLLFENKLLGSQALKRMSEERCARYREDGYKIAEKDPAFAIICALYWGEGSKSKNVFAIANCDSSMLRLIGSWLVLNGFDDKLSFRVAYYGENGLTEDDIRRKWMLDLPFLKDNHLRRFLICSINRASQRKKIGVKPYGTATMVVCSTELIQRVYGGIEFLKSRA